MDRETAHDIASQQGYEGETFLVETINTGVGEVRHVLIELEDENGDKSRWYAEVSEVNGCEAFSHWDEGSEEFRRSCIADRKAAKKKTRKTRKLA